MAAKFKMATKNKFAYVAKKTLFRLKTLKKKLKKYLEAPKSKMAAKI
jgi:hypothetical protein